MSKKLFFVLLLIAPHQILSIDKHIDKNQLYDFLVRESSLHKKEITLVAIDRANNIISNMDGVFYVSINGFQEKLHFKNGTALLPRKLVTSSFLYLKYHNPRGTQKHAYYISANGTQLNILQITWLWVIGTVVILTIVTYILRRIILIVFLLLAAFIYLVYYKDYSFSGLFETILDKLKHIV